MKTFIICFLCVAFRHSLMSAWFNSAGEIHNQLSLSSEEIASIDLMFLLFYPIGNIVFGTLGDKYSQNLVLCICSSISALIFGGVN